MGKSAPAPPDPAQTAGAQTANNVSTAIANSFMSNFNQTTPTGSLQFSQRRNPNYTPGAPGIPQIETIQGSAQNQTNRENKSQSDLNQAAESYRVGDQTFSDMGAARAYQSSLGGNNSEFMSYSMTDPNTGKVYDIPLMEAITKLSPEQQQLFNTGQMTQQELANIALSQSKRIGDHLGQEIDTSGLAAGGSAGGIRGANLRMDYQDQLGDVGPLQRGVRGQSMNTNFSGDIADAGDLTRTYGTDWSDDRRRVEEALLSRMNPNIDRDRESLRTSLLSQGIREGSEAFDRAMNRNNEQSNDARMQAILAGGQEQSRLAGLARDRGTFENQAQGQQFGQNEARRMAGNEATSLGNDARLSQFGIDMGQGQFANQAQGQAFNQELDRGTFGNNAIDRFNSSQISQQNADMGLEQFKTQQRQGELGELFALRNQPLNEIGALTAGGQVQMPTFQSYNAPQIPTVDRAGLEMDAYRSRLDAYNQKQATMGSLFGTAGKLGGAAIGAGLFGSDRRTKTDIEHVGTIGRLPVYTYRYKGGKRLNIGFMADEVEQLDPSAVVWRDGYAMVNYDRALEAAQ